MPLAMHPDCQGCGADLPADRPGAHICSHECTWCSACADGHGHRCPSCGGDMQRRPMRVGDQLHRYPASAERRFAAALA